MLILLSVDTLDDDFSTETFNVSVCKSRLDMRLTNEMVTDDR